MAKTNAQRRDSASQPEAIPDQMVSQVGKAVAQIMKLRQSLEKKMATADSEEARQNIAGQIEVAAVRAINDQGLSVDAVQSGHRGDAGRCRS